MKALNYLGPYKVRVEEVEKPKLEHPDDVIVKVTTVSHAGYLIKLPTRGHKLINCRPLFVAQTCSMPTSCNTFLEMAKLTVFSMYEGRTAAEPGITFGHENMGIVEEMGEGVTLLKKGDRVVMPFNVADGRCQNCEEGRTAFCTGVNPGFAGGAYGKKDTTVAGIDQFC